VTPPTGSASILATVARTFGTETAALTLVGAGCAEVWVAASNQLARVAQDFEYVLGEGPARDCTTGGREIVERDAGMLNRWHHYGPAVLGMGITLVAAAPLRWSAGCLGALTVFDPQLPLIGSLRAVAQDLALAVINERSRPSLLAQGDDRAAIHQAAGVVSIQCGCAVVDALALLRAYSFAHGEAIGSVASRVLRHELRLDVA
jgi:hypothetical protein